MSSENSESKILEEAEELLPPGKLAKIKQEFELIDRNKDGKIDIDEYLDYLLASERASLAKKFAYLDRNKDGFIDIEEFLIASDPQYLLLRRFRDFDANRNGVLSMSEALKIAEEFNFPITRDWLEKMSSQTDANGKKLITYNEYLGAVSRLGFQ